MPLRILYISLFIFFTKESAFAFTLFSSGNKSPSLVTVQDTPNCGGSKTFTITRPTSLREGDLMYVINWSEVNPTSLASAGWTLHTGPLNVASTYHTTNFYKIASSSDVIAANFSFTHTGSNHSQCGTIMMIFRDANQTTPVNTIANNITFGGGSTTLTYPATTTTSNYSLVVLIAAVNASLPTIPTNYRQIFYSATQGYGIYMRSVPSPTALPNPTSTVSNSDNYLGQTFQVLR